MKYRKNGKTGQDVSLLGFGAMRLPTIKGQHGAIDEEKTIHMIRHAIDNGLTYVDTAYVYHNGNSEVVVGKALKDGYREKVTVADKLPFWIAGSKEELDGILAESLRRLDIDIIDNLLVHDINEGSYENFKKFEVLPFVIKAKADGKARNIGFSYHGKTPEFFKELVDLYDWDFVQIQLNYMDQNMQAGVEGLKYLASKGIPAVIMEPLKGGKLTDILPDSITDLWETAPVKRTPADWAFRWVANFPEVTTILSGMSTIEQVEENLSILSEAEAGALTAAELSVIDAVAAEYNRLIPYGCTECRYCLPCPIGLQIPKIVGMRNEAEIFKSLKKTAFEVNAFLDVKPSACIACKKCEELCPQHLHISDIMAECAEMFEVR
ncbi:MAG: aldo/keto reductase [Clostridiales Family XIII bacterium]|jgi:predicted aldo/keto reductase-like oxidoreductase|nr:aldo/keto reductase [Clostridiales Family XIII bacterium]